MRHILCFSCNFIIWGGIFFICLRFSFLEKKMLKYEELALRCRQIPCQGADLLMNRAFYLIIEHFCLEVRVGPLCKGKLLKS